MAEQPDYRQAIHGRIFDETSFIEATFKAKEGDTTLSWQRVTIRPVLIRGERYQQFSYFDGRQTTVQNHQEQESEEALNDLLAARLKSIQVKTTTETLQVQFSRKGRPLLHHHANRQPIPLTLAHDRAKQRLLPDNQPIPFLQTIGIQTADGRIRADKQRKFRQINEFLRLIDETSLLQQPHHPDSPTPNLQSPISQSPNLPSPLLVVDLGCGSAALTFATYHYLNNLLGLPAEVVGVDVQGHIIERRRGMVRDLGWDTMSFVTSAIRNYQPQRPPDIVLALHACDTATDEALAQAIRWQSKLILSAPCCHHHLQTQLDANPTPEPFAPVMRHGILKERLGDILTDTFRALILRIMGYQTDVLQFVDPEHTPRNLMIRAIRQAPTHTEQFVTEYQALKSYWNVTPHLETLLQGIFPQQE